MDKLSIELYDLLYLDIEEYYPKYVKDTGAKDCAILRAAYYSVAINELRGMEVTDEKAMSLLLDKLYLMADEAIQEVKAELRK